MEPISAGAVFGFINSAFKFGELAVRLHEVGSENEVFVRMIQAVRRDLEETERLLSLPTIKRRLSSVPGKVKWIEGAIYSTKSALNEIGRWVERVRVDQESRGDIRFETRMRWVFNDHEKLVNRKMELATCHQQLLTVLNYLVPMEEALPPPVAEPPTYQEATKFDDFISPRQRRISTAVGAAAYTRDEKLDALVQATDPTNIPPVTVNMGMLAVSPASVNVYKREETDSKTANPYPFPTPSMPARKPVQRVLTPKPPSAIEMNQTEPRTREGHKTEITDPLRNKSVAATELEGCIPQFSANSFGPVNPFELWAGDQPSSKPSTASAKQHTTIETNPSVPTPVELPSNSAYAWELEAPFQSLNLNSFRSPKRTYTANVEAPSNFTELEASSNPTELEAPQHPSYRHRQSSQSTLSSFPSPSPQSPPLFSPPLSTAQVSPYFQTITPMTSTSTLASTQISPLNSPRPSMNSMYSGITTNLNTGGVQTGTSAGGERSQVPANEGVSANRMRRQKQLLDMLGSIGHG